MSAHNAASDLFMAPVELTDPGNAGVIYVNRSPCVVNVVSAGTETRTVDVPTRPGAFLLLNGYTIAGTVTVTVTGGYNVAGSTTFTITAAKQWFLLESVQQSTDVYRWRLLATYASGAVGTLAVAGVAAGYKIARGQATTVAASDTVVTGLATVVSAVANLDDAPVVGASFASASIGDQAGTPAAGSILIQTWKPTTAGAAGNPDVIAATTFSKKVNWIAIGT